MTAYTKAGREPETKGLSYSDARGDGSARTFQFTFAGVGIGYLSTEDIYAFQKVTDPAASDYGTWKMIPRPYTFPTTNTVTLPIVVPVPQDGKDNIRIRRIMEKDKPYLKSNTDDIFRKTVLNNSFLQTLYVMHETLDGYVSIPEGDIIEIDVSAPQVDFEPAGTGFGPAVTDVDAVIRNIDRNFVRKGTAEEIDPYPPTGSEIQPYEIWLVDSQNGVKSRTLPRFPTDGAEITIRDDGGMASKNTISITRSGTTAKIMGLFDDMTIEVDWSWVRLKYFKRIDDWRVIGGGVGAKVVQTISDEMQQLYYVGRIIMTDTEQNPAEAFGFGLWEQIGQGRTPVGIGTGFDGEDKVTFAKGAVGGEYLHTLTLDEMPHHGHNLNAAIINYSVTDYVTGENKQVQGEEKRFNSDKYPTVTKAGGGRAHNIMQPWFTCYYWKRTK